MRRTNGRTVVGCVPTLILAAFGLWLGAVLFEYALWCILDRDVPWYADVIGGAVTNAFIVPVAVVCWILRLAGVDVPFVHS